MFYRVSKFYNLDRKKPVYACHLSIFQNWQQCILNLPDTDGIIMYKTIYESSIVTSFLVDYLAGGKIVHNFFLNFFTSIHTPDLQLIKYTKNFLLEDFS